MRTKFSSNAPASSGSSARREASSPRVWARRPVSPKRTFGDLVSRLLRDEEGGFEEREIALQGAQRQAAAPGKLRVVEERPGAGGEQREKAGKSGQSLDIGEVPHVALQDRRDIGGEPGPAARRGLLADDLGVASQEGAREDLVAAIRPGGRQLQSGAEEGVDEALRPARDLPLGERPEGDDLHPAGERLGDPGQEEEVGRAGEQEAARPAVAVDLRLDRQEEVRDALDLVQGDRAGKTGQEPRGIVLGSGADGRVVQGEIAGRALPGAQFLDQGALPDLARSVQQDDRSIPQGGEQERSGGSLEHG
jgi:hypothetical protein